ncbi:MAG: ACP synthase [Candidatus Nitrosopolaris wilkensis]|nr:MAG: ACP synthase [Candidatus Nitrosopolaris wilkensis]
MLKYSAIPTTTIFVYYKELVIKEIEKNFHEPEAGRKTIETSRWNTNFRGEFLIHSSKAIDKESSALLNIDCSKPTKGAVIGVVYLYDVKKYTSREDFLADKEAHFSDNFSGPKYGFLLKDEKKLNEPIHVSGQLGFFDVS